MSPDLFISAARPDVIRRDNVDRLSARLVLPGANIAVTDEAERMLHERGVLVIPDFIANAGGVICASAEYHGGIRSDAFQAIEERVKDNTTRVLKESRDRRVMPRQVAVELALHRVQRAMSLRR